MTRSYTWDPATRALTGLSASFPIVESGSPQTVFVQKDAFVRDVMGRIVQSTAEVPVADGAVGAGQVTAECFTYDGFNRLTSAWTVADASVPTCGGAAPADDLAAGWDASDTAYAATWAYSPGGRITSLVKGAGASAATSTYAYTDAAHPAAATSVSTGSDVNSFKYDAAGRTVSRTVDDVTTNLTWDVTSSLVESSGQGGHVVYAYDASGQRVVQARVADANGVGTATAYVASGQVDDPNTASTSTGDTTATRFYTFAGSTVAIRTNDNKLSLMLGDEQGSTNVMMPVTTTTGGAMEPATLTDASLISRTSYTPYGELRGADNLAIDRGWLGQVEDRMDGASGTGLTYLNARYYDPVLSRFLSPDPLMDPGDPKTLDPYRYADNNPVVFTDASGLRPIGQYDCAGKGCNITNNGTVKASPPKHKPAPTPTKPKVPATPPKPTPNLPGPGLGGIPPIGGVPPISSRDDGSTPCKGSLAGAGCANSFLEKMIDSITDWKDNGAFRKNGAYNTPQGTPGWIKSLKKRLFGMTGRQATTAISHVDILGTPLWGIGTIASGIDAYNHLEDLGVRDEMPVWDVAFNVVGRTATGSIFGAIFEATAGAIALPGSVSAGAVCGEGVVVCAPLIDIAIMSGASIAGDMLGTYFWDNTNDARLRKRYGNGG